MIRWTPDAEMRQFFDLTAYCRVMREQALWKTTPDPTYGDAVTQCGGGTPPASVGRKQPSRRQPKVHIPSVPGFAAGLQADYDAGTAEDEPEYPHASHRKRSVNWLMHPGNCSGDCGPRKIRWMAVQPEESHVGRNGRRLAEIYGVK